MGLLDKVLRKTEQLAKPDAVKVNVEEKTLYLPVQGEVIELSEIGDGVFSEGILGDGIGIRPTEEYVYAPANGVISTVADTKHAIGMTTEEGAEVLIHVGMDTVEMKGEGFLPYVSEGDKVVCGTPIMKFDSVKIKNAGFPDTTAFVVTNSGEYENFVISTMGSMEKLTAIMKLNYQ